MSSRPSSPELISPQIPAESAWRRYVVIPIRTQLRQGCTPEKIALTLAVGGALGMFPVVGCSTVLCAAAALLLRLNQPVMQLVNYCLYPLQIALIFVFIRIGEHLYGAEPVKLSLPELLGHFRASPLGFAREFAMTLVHGVSAWLILSPLVAGVLYGVAKPLLVGASNRLRALRCEE